MFSLVAVFCLYLGIENFTDAISVPFSAWQFIHYVLFITSIGLFIVFFFSVKQAIIDFKERKSEKNDASFENTQPEDFDAAEEKTTIDDNKN